MADDLCGPATVRTIAPPDVAFSAVVDVILRRLPRPGDDVSCVADLAEETGISRASVRRALDTLTGAGLLSAHPVGDDGTRRLLPGANAQTIGGLLRLSLLRDACPDAHDVIGTRIAVERAAATAAASSADEHTLDGLRRVVIRMRDPAIRPATFGRLDLAFHLGIARAAGGIFGSFLLGLREQITSTMRQAFDHIDDWSRTSRTLADEHEEIVALLVTNRGGEAATFVSHHLDDFYRDNSLRDAPSATTPSVTAPSATTSALTTP